MLYLPDLNNDKTVIPTNYLYFVQMFKRASTRQLVIPVRVTIRECAVFVSS
jgi:hypothetical protein